MRTLVTGGAGYIGSVVAERLLEAGHDVVVLDDLSTGHREAVPPQAPLVVVDLRDRAALAEALARRRFDAVIHLAASSLVGESMEDPGKYFENNLVGGIHLLEEAIAAGASRFVLSSTAATYGEPAETPITEECPAVPTNPYGESKLLFERILAWYARLGRIAWIALRYFNAAGASAARGEDRDHETHLIPLVLSAAETDGEVQVFGDDWPTPDGTCVRDYIHVLDLADAHVLALDALDRGVQGVFNLGSGSGFSVHEVIAVAEKVVGRKIRRRIAPRRPGDPATLVASSRRAREVLGWRATRDDLEEIVRSAWEWRRRHPHGYRTAAAGR
jgi:UDP-glucose-4-epimerase GalE